MLSASLLVAAAAVVATAAPATGSWKVLDGETRSLCIHSLLLPGNKLVCIERPHTAPYPFINPLTNGTTSVLISLDTAKESFKSDLNPVVYNAFCAGHSQAADGSVYVIGGDKQSSTFALDASKQEDPSTTDSQSFLFNGIDRIRTYSTEKGWDESKIMTTARWYPTVVTMGDGDVFITSGSLKNLDFDHLENTNNPTYEFYPSRYGPNIFSSLLNWAYPHNLYPVCFQLPGGKIFQMVSNRTVLIDPRVDPQGVLEANTVEIASLPAIDHAPWIYPHTPTAFLLPLKESSNYTATVMICGGTKNSSRFASADCYSIQPDILGAKWVAMPNMPHARLMPDSAVLPDGTIMLTNGDGWGQAGSNGGESNFGAAPVLATDIYDPVTNSWSTVGTSTVPRMYHSGVVLLEDATVITTGSEMANYLDFWGTPTAVGPVDAMASVTGAGAKPECYPSGKQVCTLPYEMRIERFTPPYLSNNLPRPILSPLEKGTKFVYGSTVGVQINPTGAPVSRITFVRYTTTTHSTNTDQRMIEPNLLFLNSTYAVFKIPPTGNIAPPGNYHMFALTKDGTPSVGQTVLLGSGVATVVTIPAGSTPTKSGSVSTISTGLRDSTLALVLLAFL